MKKISFMNMMKNALEVGVGIEVKVKIPNNRHLEIITNHKDDVLNKTSYYDNTYDDDMKHKYAEGISIESARYLTFEESEED